MNVNPAEMAAKSAAVADAYRRIADWVAEQMAEPGASEGMRGAARTTLRWLNEQINEMDADAASWAEDTDGG